MWQRVQTIAGRPPVYGPGSVAPAGMMRRRLKRNRALATRYDKLAVRYHATVHAATINEWLRPGL
ncbi:hypothetical protein [Micromonospora fulviviridis]|uniref:hypothetical protein n=1 Tax=Micromonospora fulviviridis TaxID=47860 RepID=UPI0016671040|nr:hypothetical protein [Micromonospora fulviviridis]